MTQNELKNLLQTVSNDTRGGAPHEDWVAKNREILLMQVSNSAGPATTPNLAETMRRFFAIFLPMETMAGLARAAAVVVLVLGTAVGGGIVSAQVYSNAAPGDTFYGMKLAVETAQLLLSPNEEYRVRLHTDFADRRMDEVAKLAEGSADRQALVPTALAAFEKETLALRVGLESLRVNDPEGVAEVAKLMERKLVTYQNILAKAGATLPTNAKLAVNRTSNLIDSLTFKATEVIVQKHLSGDIHASQAVVETKLEDRLKHAEDKIGGATAAKSEAAKTALAEAKVLVKEQKYEAALSKIVEVAELSKSEEEVKEEAKEESGEEPKTDESVEETKTDEAVTPADETSSNKEEAPVTPKE